jgi:dTDP-D-glucose 4,6-dehydratase
VRKFVPMMILLALYGLDLEVYGNGRQTIDPIDVEDMSRFTVYACRNLGRHPHVVDLGSGEAVTVLDAAKLILQKVNQYRGMSSRSKIVHVPMRVGEGDDINLKADMSYWQSQGMRTEVSFEESISKTIRYVAGLPEYVHLNALNFYHKKALVAAA